MHQPSISQVSESRDERARVVVRELRHPSSTERVERGLDAGLIGPVLRDDLRRSLDGVIDGGPDEVVVRFRPGERVRLRSFGADLGNVVVPRVFGAEDEVDLVEFRVADRLAPSPALPATLATLDRLSEASATRRREFELEGRTLVVLRRA